MRLFSLFLSRILPLFSVLLSCGLLLGTPVQAQTPDTTPPTLTLSSPPSGAHLTEGSALTLAGSARDSGGIASISVKLYRSWSGLVEYWDGQSWQAAQPSLALSQSAPSADDTVAWTCTAPMPTGANWVAGRYNLRIWASDVAGNSSSTIYPFFLGNDTLAPQLAVVSPDDNLLGATLPSTWSGTSGDETGGSGVARVYGVLSRQQNGVTQYWNGTLWQSSAFAFDATLGAPTNGSVAWSLSPPLPSGADLERGVHLFSFTASDRSLNLRGAVRRFYVVPEDGVAPSAGIDQPTNGAHLADWSGGLSGWAQDDAAGSGLAYVRLEVRRDGSGTGEWWNGSAWQSNPRALLATLSPPDENGRSPWQLTAGLPTSASGPMGRYQVEVKAFDRYNNSGGSLTEFFIGNDTTAPWLALSAPAANATLSRLTSISGSAGDEAGGSGLARVDVQLQRTVNGVAQWWNGSAWTPTLAYLSPRGASGQSANWTRTQNLPSGTNLPTGSYTLAAQTFDASANASTVVTRSFSVVANTLPQAQSQSVTTSRNQALALTLAASDAQSDALSYRIVSGPQHGTLSGAVPNLVYTPTAGYSGPDSFSFAAGDWGGEGAPATISLDVIPPPPLDALVQGESEESEVGANIINLDATGQTLQREVFGGQSALFYVRVRHGSTTSQTLKLLTPAPAANWQLRAFVLPGATTWATGGTEITQDLTAPAGWQSVAQSAEDVVVRLELTPDASMAAGAQAEVLVRAEGNGSADAVKAVATARVAYQPDLSIRRLPSGDETLTDEEAEALGEGILNTDATTIRPDQILERVTVQGQSELSAIKIKNASGTATTFAIKLPPVVPGWTVKLFDALENGNEITTQGLSEAGWTTPIIEADMGLELRMEVTAGTGDFSAEVRANNGPKFDGVAAHYAVQGIAKLQWSADGENWHDVVAGVKPLVQQYGTISFRAVKSQPDWAWPGEAGELPSWGGAGDGLSGEEVTLHFAEAGDEKSVSVACGNQKTMVVRVRPAYDVLVTASQGLLMTSPGAAALTQSTLSVLVTDEDGNPQAGVPLRFAVKDEAGNATGEIGAAGIQDDIATTGADGKAAVIWTSGTQSGQMSAEVQLTDEGATTADADGVTLQVAPPYARLELGSWQEDANGAWLRTVKVSTWFVGQKIGGRNMQLTARVLDENEVALVGWENAAALDATTVTTGTDGTATTVQRWTPIEAGAWPHDYEVKIEATIQ